MKIKREIFPLNRMLFKQLLLTVALTLFNVPNHVTANKEEENQQSKPYLITFHDDASEEVFNSTVDWLRGRNLTVSDTFYEEYIKFFATDMDDETRNELEKNKEAFQIETIEEDYWDGEDEDHDEL